MIHIDYPSNRKPPEEWLEKANALTADLIAAADKTTRDKIIDSNAQLWGEIKEWLEEFSNGKCWFSEARDTCSYWHVEHFRPKKGSKDSECDGYWWRAFDYLNYRLCGGVVNSKKGSFFPLRVGTTAARGPGDNCDDESPLLIDPTVESDVMLLTFAEGGKAVPVEPEGWYRERAIKSIERYKLNAHPALCRAREDIWNVCRLDAEKMDVLLAEQKVQPSSSREQRIKDIAKKLRERTRPTSQFSAVARAFLAQYPKDWAKRCIA